MQDYYRINVAKDGVYLFATEQGGITRKEKAEQLYMLFCEKFPKEDGYEVFVVYWESRGHGILFV